VLERAGIHIYIDPLIKPTARLVLIAALAFGGFGAVGAVAGHVVGLALAGLLGLVLIRDSIPFTTRNIAPMYGPVCNTLFP
jgi:hypothetical protein